MHWSQLAIPITGILLPLLLVPTVMAMRLRQRKREWEHLERMKSLDLGLPVPVSSHGGGVAAIGAGVPIVAFLMSFLATMSLPDGLTPIGIEHQGASQPFQAASPINIQFAIIWGTAMSVSLLAMLVALILGVVQARAQSRAMQSSQWASAHSKPAFDPEAYEFAGHRG